MSKIIIVHGEKPTRSCAIHPAFIERLKVAIAVCDKEKFDYLIISGGANQKKMSRRKRNWPKLSKGKGFYSGFTRRTSEEHF